MRYLLNKPLKLSLKLYWQRFLFYILITRYCILLSATVIEMVLPWVDLQSVITGSNLNDTPCRHVSNHLKLWYVLRYSKLKSWLIQNCILSVVTLKSSTSPSRRDEGWTDRHSGCCERDVWSSARFRQSEWILGAFNQQRQPRNIRWQKMGTRYINFSSCSPELLANCSIWNFVAWSFSVQFRFPLNASYKRIE